MSSSSRQESSEPEDLIKIINPNDFDVYEDYVDAYICADDIKFLQVQSMSCWNQTLESFIDKSSLSQDLEASRLLLHLGQTGSFPVIFSENV